MEVQLMHVGGMGDGEEGVQLMQVDEEEEV